jgi:hypothetical protein
MLGTKRVLQLAEGMDNLDVSTGWEASEWEEYDKLDLDFTGVSLYGAA